MSSNELQIGPCEPCERPAIGNPDLTPEQHNKLLEELFELCYCPTDGTTGNVNPDGTPFPKGKDDGGQDCWLDFENPPY